LLPLAHATLQRGADGAAHVILCRVGDVDRWRASAALPLPAHARFDARTRDVREMTRYAERCYRAHAPRAAEEINLMRDARARARLSRHAARDPVYAERRTPAAPPLLLTLPRCRAVMPRRHAPRDDDAYAPRRFDVNVVTRVRADVCR